MNIIHFTGNVGRDAELRSTGSGDVCNFSVAVKQGFGRDAPSAWYRVEMWGKRAAGIAPHITKGMKVAVAGEFIIDEYEGKPQYRVRASEVEFLSAKSGDGARQEPSYAAAEDLADEVPF
jgi:single-strand DNA-binding protein